MSEQAVEDRIVLRRVEVINPEEIQEYIQTEGYQALRKAVSEMTPEEIIKEVQSSGLRG